MLVKCDKCGQSYEVNESRLSPKGARIKCPTCAHIFLVRLDAAPEEPEAPAVVEEKPAAQESEGPTWKVRHIGLTYSFHDLESLRDWLSSRASLDDVKVAKNEDEWRELGDYPEVLTTELITKFFPLGDVPKSGGGSKPAETSEVKDSLRSPSGVGALSSPVGVSMDLSAPVSSAKTMRQIKKERQKAEEARKNQKKRLMTIVILVILLVAVAILGLRHFQTESGGGVPEPDVTVVTPSAEPVAKPDPAPKAEAAPQPAPVDAPVAAENEENKAEEIADLAELELQKLLAEADDLVAAKKWPEARATLEQLNNDMPNDVAVMQLLVKTYRGLGMNDKAAALEASIRRVKADKAQN